MNHNSYRKRYLREILDTSAHLHQNSGVKKLRKSMHDFASSISVTSNLFTNSFPDQYIFQQVYNNISNTHMMQKLLVPQDIVQNIAEYATGYTHLCANRNCDDKVNILSSDRLIYNLDHKNAIKVGYKRNVREIEGAKSVWFCIKCMDDVVDCGCNECIFKPKTNYPLFHPNNHNKCHNCSRLIVKCPNHCKCNQSSICKTTDCDSKLCGSCTIARNGYCSSCNLSA